jgi:hypothetical protein
VLYALDMGRGQQGQQGQGVALRPEIFIGETLAYHLGEVRTAEEIVLYMSEIFDTDVMPWEAQIAWNKHCRERLAQDEGTLYQLVEVPIKSLQSYAGTLASKTNPGQVSKYVEHPNPPPLVFRAEDGPRLFDGHHRLQAALIRGDQTVLAWVPQGASFKDSDGD